MGCKKMIANLVGGWATPLKNMSSSIGMMTFPILMGKCQIHGNQLPPTSNGYNHGDHLQKLGYNLY